MCERKSLYFDQTEEFLEICHSVLKLTEKEMMSHISQSLLTSNNTKALV